VTQLHSYIKSKNKNSHKQIHKPQKRGLLPTKRTMDSRELNSLTSMQSVQVQY